MKGVEVFWAALSYLSFSNFDLLSHSSATKPGCTNRQI